MTEFNMPTMYELQLFRDGRWRSSGHYFDRAEALVAARRLDGAGKLVRLRADTLNRSGRELSTRTIYLGTTIKNAWKDGRPKLAVVQTAASRQPDAEIGTDRVGINPYRLLASFTAIAFVGLAMLVALHAVYGAA